jgi:hypothetical protein
LNESKLGGYSTGWRLPEKRELVTLIDPMAEPPAYFPRIAKAVCRSFVGSWQ